MAKSKGNLTDSAIKELESLLKDSDKKIRLRAISLILRHSDKVRRDDPLKDIDALIKSFDANLEKQKNKSKKAKEVLNENQKGFRKVRAYHEVRANLPNTDNREYRSSGMPLAFTTHRVNENRD